MKKLNFIIVVMILLSSFGCRTYLGYREYDEKIALVTKNEKIINISYNAEFIDNKLQIMENKEIEYTQNIRTDKIKETIYHDKYNIIGNIILFPLALILSPIGILGNNEIINFENNTYIKPNLWFWYNALNIFTGLPSGKPEGKEKNIRYSTFQEEKRNKTVSRKIAEPIDINIIVAGKKYTTKNNISMYELCELIFDKKEPNQGREISAYIDNINFKFYITSNDLFNFADEMNTCNDVNKLLDLIKKPTATKYDILLIEKRLKNFSLNDIEACKALVQIYSTDYFNNPNKPFLTADAKKSEITKYQELIKQKEEDLRIKREKQLAKYKWLRNQYINYFGCSEENAQKIIDTLAQFGAKNVKTENFQRRKDLDETDNGIKLKGFQVNNAFMYNNAFCKVFIYFTPELEIYHLRALSTWIIKAKEIQDNDISRSMQQKLSESEQKKIENKRNNLKGKNEFQQLTELFDNKYISFWNGECTPVVQYVKKRLNDPDSFKHVKTVRYLSNEQNREMTIIMQFRAKNVFGALITSEVTAVVQLSENGDIENTVSISNF